jgi:predicted kinase
MVVRAISGSKHTSLTDASQIVCARTQARKASRSVTGMGARVDHAIVGLGPAGPWGRARWAASSRVPAVSSSVQFAEDADVFRRAEEVLRTGGTVIEAFTHGDKNRRSRATEIMKSAGAHDVIYWG